MSYRNDYINRNKSATEQRIAEQQAANTEMTNQYIQDINSVIDKSTDAAVNKVQGEIDKLPTTYQSTFDANAVNQKINERKLANRMENLGLIDSGLNRTQQTALTLQRANADAATRQQMNAASLSLKQQIADIISQGETKKAETAATAKFDLAQQNQSVYNSLMNELYSNADSYANSQIEAQDSKSYSNVTPKAFDQSAMDVLNEAVAMNDDGGSLLNVMNNLVEKGYNLADIEEYVVQLEKEKIEAEKEKTKKAKTILNAFNKYLKDKGKTEQVVFDDTNAVSKAQQILESLNNNTDFQNSTNSWDVQLRRAIKNFIW